MYSFFLQDPTCTTWIELGPKLAKEMGRTASSMLDNWKPQHDHVVLEDAGERKTTEWPVYGAFPCCGDSCQCDRDIPPQKGQAPRAKPKSGGRFLEADVAP